MEIRRWSILSTGQNVSLSDNDDNGAPYQLLNAIKQKDCKSLQLLINAITTTLLFIAFYTFSTYLQVVTTNCFRTNYRATVSTKQSFHTKILSKVINRNHSYGGLPSWSQLWVESSRRAVTPISELDGQGIESWFRQQTYQHEISIIIRPLADHLILAVFLSYLLY